MYVTADGPGAQAKQRHGGARDPSSRLDSEAVGSALHTAQSFTGYSEPPRLGVVGSARLNSSASRAAPRGSSALAFKWPINARGIGPDTYAGLDLPSSLIMQVRFLEL